MQETKSVSKWISDMMKTDAGISKFDKEVMEETRAAAEVAHKFLHWNDDRADKDSSYKELWDTGSFPTLHSLSVGRLQLLLLGYIGRLIETISYRPDVTLTGTGFSYQDRALRDTIVGPSNSHFALGAIPDSCKDDDKPEWLMLNKAVGVCFTHRLCFWLVEILRKPMKSNTSHAKLLHDPDDTSQMPFVKNIIR